MSDGFDPDKDLVAIGLANQTTMLRNETTEIGKLLEKTMMEKYGPAALKQHYMVLDTICDATQVLHKLRILLWRSWLCILADRQYMAFAQFHPPALPLEYPVLLCKQIDKASAAHTAFFANLQMQFLSIVSYNVQNLVWRC